MSEITFLPTVTARKRDDGRWTIDFDWSDSLQGEWNDRDHAHDPDTALSAEASVALDRWLAAQPTSLIIPAAEAGAQ